MVEDPSFLAERMAYDVFRAAGLPAPRCNSALVYVNGVFYGVYANVEAEDKTFLRRWFASDDGQPLRRGPEGLRAGAETAFDLETNETGNDRTDLANLIGVVSGRPAPRPSSADDRRALDTAHFLRFTAAEAAVNQWDMYAYTVFYPNNFRIYHDPDREQVRVPAVGHGHVDEAVPRLGQAAHRDLRARAPVRSSRAVPSPPACIFQRCLSQPRLSHRATPPPCATSSAVLRGAGAGGDSPARYHDQIRAHVAMDPRKEYTMQQFETAYQSLVRTIRERPGAIRAEIGN